MSLQEFINKYNGKGIDFELARRVDLDVLRSSKDHQVLWSVVLFVVIQVMNDLIASQKPSHLTLHDQPVLGDIAIDRLRMAWIPDKHITISSNDATTAPTVVVMAAIPSSRTWIRTEAFSLSAPIFELFTAIVTCSEVFSRCVITSATTKSRVIARWFIEVIETLRTLEEHRLVAIVCPTLKGVNI